MRVIYTKADKAKGRSVGTIIKTTNRFKDWHLVQEYTGEFPPKGKTKIQLKDLK